MWIYKWELRSPSQKDHEADFIFPTKITKKRVQDKRIITITTSQLQICSAYLDKWGHIIGIPSGPMSQRLSKLIALSFQDIECFHPVNYCKPTWLVGKIPIFTRIYLYIYIYIIYNYIQYIYIYWIYPPHPSMPVTTMTHFWGSGTPQPPKPRISQASSVRANRSHTFFLGARSSSKYRTLRILDTPMEGFEPV